MNKTEREAMKNIDIMSVDPSTLKDIQNVKIDVNLPKTERMKQYIKQIINPYYCICDDIIVKVNNIETTKTIDDVLKSFILDL